MVVYEEIYFEAYTNDQCISHKNNIAELSYIGIFPVYLRMVLIFTDFPTGGWVLTMGTIGNL